MTLKHYPPGNDILVKMVGDAGSVDSNDLAKLYFDSVSVMGVMEE